MYQQAEVAHDDRRRTLYSVFNGDFGGFSAKHLKWFEMKQDAVLGRHYHEYAEVFCVIHGEGRFDLVPVNKPEERVSYEMKRGDVIFIPARVAHRSFFKKDSLVVSCNAEFYTSPKENDIPFDDFD